MDNKKELKSAIKIKDLSWSFGQSQILENINLSFQKGDFTSIIGPNGSGKTTLLRNISTWLKPKKETIFLYDKDVLGFGNKALARNMSFVSQSPTIAFDFTVMDVVLMGRAPHIGRFQSESSKDLEIVRESMEMTGTWHLKDRLISQLSGGEFQRVVVARAISQKTEIILMDEPISHLDIHHKIEILDLMKRLQLEKGITIIAVLHDLNLAVQYSDMLVLVDKGRIKSSGKPEDVITRENIRQVYGIDVYMMKNPVNGLPHIVPIPSSFDNVNSKKYLKKQDL